MAIRPEVRESKVEMETSDGAFCSILPVMQTPNCLSKFLSCEVGANLCICLLYDGTNDRMGGKVDGKAGFMVTYGNRQRIADKVMGKRKIKGKAK